MARTATGKALAWVAVVCAILGVRTSWASSRPDDIHAAVMRNDIGAVRGMLDQDPSLVKATNSMQETPLHKAASAGLVDLAHLLLANGAEVNAVAYNSFTPLHLTQSGDVARALIKAGANLEGKDNWGKTPLQAAVQSQRMAVAEAIIDAGIQVDLSTALTLRKRDLVKKIIEADPRAARSTSGRADLWGSVSPLGIAAGQGDKEIVTLLLDAGADVNEGTRMPNASGEATPLCNAIWWGHDEIAELLLERGATTRGAGGKYYDSIFGWAVQHASPRIVQLLLEHGALQDEGRLGFAMRRAPLTMAASNGELAKVALLLKHGADYFNDEDLRRALFAAALAKRREIVDLLRAEGARSDIFVHGVLGERETVLRYLEGDPALVNAHDAIMNRSLLSWTIVSGQRDLAVFLLECGADADDRSPGPAWDEPLFEGTPRPGFSGVGGSATAIRTPLHCALGVGDVVGTRPDANLVHALLDEGADPNVPGWLGETPLMAAARADDPETVADLLAHGANPNARDELGSTALHAAIGSERVMKVLLSGGADPGLALRGGATPLELAVLAGGPGVADLLLERDGGLTLYVACVIGRPDFVREAITRDPATLDADCSVHVGITPLMVAAQYGQLEVVRVLVEAGARINYDDARRTTPLHAAAEGGNIEVARFLLEHGADLTASSYQGTALHRAAMHGKLGMVKFLIESGGQVNEAAHGGGWTPLDAVASWSDSAEVAEFLIAAGGEVNHRTSASGTTPLHSAASSGGAKVAEVLLAHGADPAMRDSRSMTALDWALRENEYDEPDKRASKAKIAEMLRKHR